MGRHHGQVVFVRHAIPGETVRVEITRSGPSDRYLFADTVEVLRASPDRVDPGCPVAGICGGCDFQHIAEDRQRLLKAEVVSEQLSRLAGIDRTVEVRAVPRDGPGWRTRTRFTADSQGRWGLRRHASHDVVAIDTCPISLPGVNRSLAQLAPGRPDTQVLIVDRPDGDAVVVPLPAAEAPEVQYRVADRRWRASADLFWQVHPAAPATLIAAVAPHVADAARWWDLYCGVGLFAGALATDGRQVMAVEGDRRAAERAADNLADLSGVRVFAADVGRWLRSGPEVDPDVIVVDPPRTGIGKGVIAALSRTGATTVVYVACDPASLARDVARLGALGWELEDVTGFDLFPMTHHVETVAVLRRGRVG